jgi:hypothetical protein
MAYNPLDIYNAMCDAESGYDGGALDRLVGNNGLDNDDDYDDDLYTDDELRARGLLPPEDDD